MTRSAEFESVFEKQTWAVSSPKFPGDTQVKDKTHRFQAAQQLGAMIGLPGRSLRKFGYRNDQSRFAQAVPDLQSQKSPPINALICPGHTS
jgi:hypothetical protein